MFFFYLLIHLGRSLPSCLFPSGFSTETFNAVLSCATRAPFGERNGEQGYDSLRGTLVEQKALVRLRQFSMCS
jgi:hypothetical protein